VLSQYEAKMDIPSFNFYYLADSKHNPERKSLWLSEPYVDPAGRGWMVSAVAPVYFKAAKGRQFIKSDTAVEHPNADAGFVSLVIVAHFVWIRSCEFRLL
jgi:hypothetical protein